MRALHLPGLTTPSADPPYSYPNNCPGPSALTLSTFLPKPSPIPSTQTVYTLKVLTTALTRAELTWAETLAPPRFTTSAGPIPGHDVVGVVEKVSPSRFETPSFIVGDKVIGLLAFNRDGAAAEYTNALSEELALAPPKPGNVTMSDEEWDVQLATIPLSGLTAWQMLSRGKLEGTSGKGTESRKRVLVTGAAGTVGVLLVQLLKAMDEGIHVTAVSSRDNARFVRDQLGADEVLDKTQLDGPGIEPFDTVLDTTGGALLKSILLDERLVSEHAIVISIAHPLEVYDEDARMAVQQSLERRGVAFCFFVVAPNGGQLEQIGRLITEGEVRGHVDSLFELKEGKEAMMKVETRGAVKRGKVVIRAARAEMD